VRLAPDAPLSDGEVVVRRVELTDAEPYARAFADDPELGTWLGFEADPDETWARARFADAPQAARELRFGELGIVDAREGAWAGDVVVHHAVERSLRCELGVFVGAGHRGRGFARRALALVVDWLFTEGGMARIEVSTTPDNVPMLALARALAFVQEGTLRRRDVERGRRVDVVWFGLLREEWPGRARPR